MRLLYHHAPLKKKVLRANNAPNITKKLRKAIMKRSKLEKNLFKNFIRKLFKGVWKTKKVHKLQIVQKREKNIF